MVPSCRRKSAIHSSGLSVHRSSRQVTQIAATGCCCSMWTRLYRSSCFHRGATYLVDAQESVLLARESKGCENLTYADAIQVDEDKERWTDEDRGRWMIDVAVGYVVIYVAVGYVTVGDRGGWRCCPSLELTLSLCLLLFRRVSICIHCRRRGADHMLPKHQLVSQSRWLHPSSGPSVYPHPQFIHTLDNTCPG